MLISIYQNTPHHTPEDSNTYRFVSFRYHTDDTNMSVTVTARPVFTHGPLGPGTRAANFQGRHIKKIEIEVWYAEKKGCPRERNLREIYTENNVGTEFSRYDATGARRS